MIERSENGSGLRVQDARFSREDLLKVAGVTAKTLQNWIARGVIAVEEASPGRGRAREFTAFEVARIRLAKKLVGANVPVVAAFGISEAFKKLWDAAPGATDSEPNFADWLIAIPAEEWTSERKRAVMATRDVAELPAYDLVFIWKKTRLDDPKRGILPVLAAVSDAAPVMLQVSSVLDDAMFQLKSRMRARLAG